MICGYWTVARTVNNDLGGKFGALVVATTALVWINALFFLRSTFLQISIFISGIDRILWI